MELIVPMIRQLVTILAALLPLTELATAQDARIEIRADQIEGQVSRLLTGACIEDVNHEIYGGLYSQMIFGESFQEPPPAVPPKGFKAFGGTWTVRDGELRGSGGDGPKLVSEAPAFANGEVSVDVFFADRRPGNAGLILRVAKPGPGADNFDGYEVSLDAAAQTLRLGRHRHNWELIKDTPYPVPVGQWLSLTVKLAGEAIEVEVEGQSALRHDDGAAALLAGGVGLRQWLRDACYRNFRVKTGTGDQPLAFEPTGDDAAEISGMWRPLRRGSAIGTGAIEKERPFVGTQSQRLGFTGGEGECGIENQGLNRWGMHFVAGKPYEGVVWARAEKSAEVWAALESADGAAVLTETPLRVQAGDWQRLEFVLTPPATATQGRFALKLKQPGAVTLGYASLQPGPWGRFKNLPVRRDVAEALIDQGLTVLRYGGSMINHPEYRWKKMCGPRDRRPPSRGTWYPYSSNGWGIPDFMDFCEAADMEYIPAFNIDESPQDMADFIDYAKAAEDSKWGHLRVADGHPQPYRLTDIQLGNEERVDENYATKFEALAKAIWAKDPAVILVVGDFAYSEPIQDPFNFRGAASGITSLAAHQRILRLAKSHGREVWFDVHINTSGPRLDSSFDGMLSYMNALERIAEGARHRVVVFEFNANNHDLRRGLANALAIHAVARDGRIPIALSANCLQPDGQNDNGWNQGLLFLNPSQVWLQPPGYVTQMVSRNYLPLRVACQVTGADNALDVTANRSEDGRKLVLRVVNSLDREVTAQIHLTGFTPAKPLLQLTGLSGPLGAVNTADHPGACVPRASQATHGLIDNIFRQPFPPHSLTVIRLE